MRSDQPGDLGVGATLLAQRLNLIADHPHESLKREYFGPEPTGLLNAACALTACSTDKGLRVLCLTTGATSSGPPTQPLQQPFLQRDMMALWRRSRRVSGIW